MELAHLVLVAHRDPPDLRATQVLRALPDLRVTPVNEDLPDQRDLGVFRVPLDLLVEVLEEHLFLVLKDLGVPLDRLGQRGIRVQLGLRETTVFPDPLVPPE